jgi:hypothetical protein
VNEVLKRYGFIGGDGDLGLAGVAVTGEQLPETGKIIVLPLDRHRPIFLDVDGVMRMRQQLRLTGAGNCKFSPLSGIICNVIMMKNTSRNSMMSIIGMISTRPFLCSK